MVRVESRGAVTLVFRLKRSLHVKSRSHNHNMWSFWDVQKYFILTEASWPFFLGGFFHCFMVENRPFLSSPPGPTLTAGDPEVLAGMNGCTPLSGNPTPQASGCGSAPSLGPVPVLVGSARNYPHGRGHCLTTAGLMG